MLITKQNLSKGQLSLKNDPKQRAGAQASPPDNALTLHNEPHIPMDSVMRGFQKTNWRKAGDIALSVVSGAVIGGASGAFGRKGMMLTGTVAGGVASGARGFANYFIGGAISELEGREYDPSGRLNDDLQFDIQTGVATGFVASGLGLALTAATGMSPVLAGAITGAGTYLASDLAMGLLD